MRFERGPGCPETVALCDLTSLASRLLLEGWGPSNRTPEPAASGTGRGIAHEPGDEAHGQDDTQADTRGYSDEGINQDRGRDEKPDQDGERRAAEEMEERVANQAACEFLGCTPPSPLTRPRPNRIA